MTYFKDNYNKLRFPVPSDEKPGLRNAQIGAIHAIGSHFTLGKDPVIIVMPTGSGKTAVLMMAPFLLMSRRTMVVTPSRLVRSQIFEEFKNLNLLKRIGAIPSDVQLPSVKEIDKRILDEQQWEDCRDAVVVVGTPNSMSPAYSAIPSPKDDLFDLLLIDEAHHTPARTWNGIIEAFPNAKIVLFTATPFRRDKKEIRGKFIYSYPLRKAYQDGIFGQIEFFPVIPGANQSSDLAICENVESIFNQDRENGFNHSVMIRTDTRKRAGELKEIYSRNSNLRLRVIHSGHSYRHIKGSIKKLREKNLDGIICVDMLGEGFDYPNLKIAAIHAPHKSLEVTLQFIGRFARTSSDNDDLGQAKFLAVPSEIEIESKRLYDEGAVWQEMITNLSQTRISREIAVRESIDTFEVPLVVTPNTEDISIYALHPYSHVKIYEAASQVDISDPIAFPPNLATVYHRVSPELNSAIFITIETRIPKWTEMIEFQGAKYDLFVIFADPNSRLLFINSSRRSDNLYERIVKHYSPDGHKILPLSKVNKVLTNLRNPAFFNIGMKNRVLNSSMESYRIISGARAQEAIRRSDSQLFHRGHVFGKAEEDDEKITIGYSSASKVWSNKYDRIPDLISWCKKIALKINSDAIVQTFSRLDLLSVGQEISDIPSDIIYASLSELSFRQPLIFEYTDKNRVNQRGDLLDLQINVIRDSTTTNSVQLSITYDDLNIPIEFSLTADVYFRVVDPEATGVYIQKGHDVIELIDYLNANPLDMYLADMSRLNGSDLFAVNPELVAPFDPKNVIPLNWIENGVDITNEFSPTNNDGDICIHEFMTNFIGENEPAVLIYDHRTGEIADHIAIFERQDEILIELYHSKRSGGDEPATRLNDVYEVTSQVIKSTYWINRPQVLLDKIRSRIRSGSQMLIGDTELLSSIFERMLEKRTRYRICVVQPGISKQLLSEQAQRVLAAAGDYALRASSEELLVFASE